MASTASRTLSAPVTVAFDYTRSVGPVLGRFLTGLRDGQLVGARLSDGTVAVPPPEFDPSSHSAVTDFVDLPDTGTVRSWTWVAEPVAGQPFERPFAFALIQLDGADTSVLHAVDVASPDEISTGLRVRARWAAERTGSVTDLVFEPEAAPAGPAVVAVGGEPVAEIVTPTSLDYRYAASPEESAFFRGLAEGRIVGQRCPTCGT